MSRIELAGTLPAARVYVMQQGDRYKPDALGLNREAR